MNNPTTDELINTDSYRSDEWILKTFEDYFDPCPLNDNPIFDGLKIDWKKKTFVNPPYSNPLPWVKKAIEESNKGNHIVMLLKMDTSTKWFKELQEAGAKFLWINGRLYYRSSRNTYNGNIPGPSPFPSMFVILESKIKQALEGKKYE